jgi:hypothetical protein
MVRSREAASRTMRSDLGLILRDARNSALLRMRDFYSNGTSIAVFFSSHSGTGRFFDRMNSGLNSFD